MIKWKVGQIFCVLVSHIRPRLMVIHERIKNFWWKKSLLVIIFALDGHKFRLTKNIMHIFMIWIKNQTLRVLIKKDILPKNKEIHYLIIPILIWGKTLC